MGIMWQKAADDIDTKASGDGSPGAFGIFEKYDDSIDGNSLKYFKLGIVTVSYSTGL